jgi:hypothetical protein
MPGQYFGKYTGIVKDNRDDQKLGQVQVSVPTIFPPDELITARAALPYGFFFVPENEAKVWIEFEGGDSGLPLWTGVQYVPGEWAPEAEADIPKKRVIKTAAGHLIMFEDTSREEAITIKDGVNGHVVVLNKDGIVITDGANSHVLTLDGQGIAVADGVNSHTLTLDGSGVTIESAGDVTIKGQTITIEATADITIKGTNTTIEASAKLAAKGNPIHLNP